jgi:hypothetical protein
MQILTRELRAPPPEFPDPGRECRGDPLHLGTWAGRLPTLGVVGIPAQCTELDNVEVARLRVRAAAPEGRKTDLVRVESKAFQNEGVGADALDHEGDKRKMEEGTLYENSDSMGTSDNDEDATSKYQTYAPTEVYTESEQQSWGE